MLNPQISRREFLKLVSTGSLAFALRDLRLDRAVATEVKQGRITWSGVPLYDAPAFNANQIHHFGKDKVVEIAQKVGCTPSQVAINWVRQQRKAVVVPVLGARSQAQIQENLEALNHTLSQECVQEIEALSNFKVGFPVDFLHDDEVIGLVHGKTYPSIDNHRA